MFPKGHINHDYWTLEEGYLAGCWIVETGRVNLSDLINACKKPGAIVRVESQEAIKFIPGNLDNYERVAGLISDCGEYPAIKAKEPEDSYDDTPRVSER
jgi:hypothetical protein